VLTLEEAITWFNTVASKVKEVPNANRRRQLAAILLSLFQRAYIDLLRKKYKSKEYMPIIPTREDHFAAESLAMFLLTIKDEEERAAYIARLYEAMQYYFENFEEFKFERVEDILSFKNFHKVLSKINAILAPAQFFDE